MFCAKRVIRLIRFVCPAITFVPNEHLSRSSYVLQMFTQGVCVTDNIEVWEIVITVTTTIYLLLEAHQAYSEVSSVNLILF